MQDLRALMSNPGYRALWQKTLEGFREISGKDWQTRADYPHFWPLVGRLYALAYGAKAQLPDD